jgi:hypothetical protein
VAPIGKATPEHMRKALLAGEQRRIDARTGEVRLFGNRYWSPECGRLHGQRVTVRFDPDNLLRDVHLYDQGDHYLCTAQLLGDVQFLDAAEAKATAKRVAEYRKKIRDAAEAEDLLTAAQVAAVRPHPRTNHARAASGAPSAPSRQRCCDQGGPSAPEPPAHEAKVFAALSHLRVVD